MLHFPNNQHLIQTESELPTQFIGAHTIYLDFETTSGSKTLDSLNPHHSCSIAGFGITVDDCPDAYYCDIREVNALQFLQDLIWNARLWVNHHIKYDAHVAINEGLQLPDWLELRCTIVRAKLIDSDRGGVRGGYGLTPLCAAWLKHDITPYELALQPFLRNNKDYGLIPSDIMAPYCCVDVQEVRLLDAYITNRLPERCLQVAETEQKLTKELVKLEQYGMRFDPLQLKQEQFILLNRLSDLDEQLTQLVGRSFRPTVNDDCNEILCGQYGLPVVHYTKDSETGEDTENASFDKIALAGYKAMPFAPQEVIHRIIEFRKLSQRNSLFMVPWQRLAPDGIIHPTYDQVKRTGRLGCSEPNAQQMDEFMASLIIPRSGNSIISSDASQIEYRVIAHYINNEFCINSYNENPDTDFHSLVAAMVQKIVNAKIGRSPAKTLNFQHAFGSGKAKVISAIAANDDVVKAVKEEVERLFEGMSEDIKRQEFNNIVKRTGVKIYEAYHDGLPELKPVFKQAEATCKMIERRLGGAPSDNGIPHYYGYITNLSGRDRHLAYAQYRTDYKTPDPYDKAWLAFPTVVSSSAADLMKERLVELMRNTLKGLPFNLIATVHDELVWECPTDLANDFRTKRDIVSVLESPATPLAVPIRWSIGISDKNWLDASLGVEKGGKAGMLTYDKSESQNMDWMRYRGH